MLRSLVGSEMCIRDSFNPEGYPTNFSEAAVAGLKRHRSPWSWMLVACDCLLYTSDAADDLLCVDLGGRRIIKKKTTLLTLH